MKSLFEKLNYDSVLISDGAWGTMLQAKGLQAGDCPELWNIEYPDRVGQVAAAYVEAGSQLILTNTFGGSTFKLANYNLHHKTGELNRAGVEISKKVAGDDVFVIASVGPTGKIMQPLGNISEDEMFNCFQLQIASQVEGGPNAILIETMSDLREAVTAVRAAKSLTHIPVMVTMTFERGKRGYRTMMGVDIKQTVETLSNEGVDILGTNCGNGIEQIIEIVTEMRSYTDKHIIAHPNAGLPKLVGDRTIFDQTPAEMAQHIPSLIKAGANIIGGCCGTTPDHIKAVSGQLRGLKL